MIGCSKLGHVNEEDHPDRTSNKYYTIAMKNMKQT